MHGASRMRTARALAIATLTSTLGCASAAAIDATGVATTRGPAPSVGIPDTPTAQALALLRKREGYRETVYRGPSGRLVAGYGHALTPAERSRYAQGARVASADLARWDLEDTGDAWRTASAQATEIGEPRLTEALFAVVYQLGPNWRDVHRNTWRLLEAHDWEGAAREAEDSGWFRQTPLRVRDFQRALRRL